VGAVEAFLMFTDVARKKIQGSFWWVASSGIQAPGLKSSSFHLEIPETSNQVLVGHTAMDLVALGQRADKEQCAAEEPGLTKSLRQWSINSGFTH